MTNLTEQWKKGELPSGWYYVKNEFGNIFLSEYSEDYDCISDRAIKDFFTEVSRITEIIASAPSYVEYINLKSKLQVLETSYNFDTDRLEKENTKLKELLKECRFLLSKTPYENMSQYLTFTDVMKRIDKILGEE